MSERRARPWIFGLTSIPFGVGGAFAGVAMPFMLRRAGLPVDRVAAITAIVLLPAGLQFLWAPAIDVGPRRRTWLVALAAAAGVATVAAMSMPLPRRLDAFVPLAFLSSALSGLISACNGGLIATTLPDADRGKAAGWLNAGNLGGGALGAGATISLLDVWPAMAVGVAIGVMMIAPALAALAVAEPARAAGRRAGAVLREMATDVWRTLRARHGWTGALVCLSPVGTAALLNVFSGLGADYQASDGTIAFVNGYASGLVTAAGALIGGYVCDRMDKRLAYLLAGGLTAVCGLAMAAAPITPATYTVGVLAYLFVAGLCYAAFSSFVLHVIGNARATASTQYTLYSAAGNQAIAYVVWLDGKGSAWGGGGPRGVLVTDAVLNLAGIALLVILFAALRRRPDAAAVIS